MTTTFATGRRAGTGRGTTRARSVGAGLIALATAVFTVLAAWPIYQTAQLFIVASAGLVLGAGLAYARALRRLSAPVTGALAIVAFALTVVPVARPQSFGEGLARGVVDALSATVLGWKQLLTLTLPVGGYQAVLVPAYVVAIVAVFAATRIALAPGKGAAWAAIPLIAPIAFGTVFGSSAVSEPIRLGPLTLWAPRETVIWLAGAVIAAVWIVWITGAERRAALRLGRRDADAPRETAASEPETGAASGPPPAGRRGVQVLVGAAVVVAALLVGIALAPAVTGTERDVPRDRVDPALVVREQISPLAGYRSAKRDAALDTPLIEVSATGKLPERLRFAVLDAYDGVDFHVGEAAADRFTRFPSGRPLADPVEVDVRIAEGYDGIWMPTAGLGDPPRFTGARAGVLADALYVNAETGAAIAVPETEENGSRTEGLRAGDGYIAPMDRAPSGELVAGPLTETPRIDLETVPELAAWIERQDVPSDAAGLTELIDRLRDRGYLSHAITADEGDGTPAVWLQRLADEYGAGFEPSAGGHSLARLEALFEQLNIQEQAAGESPTPSQLVAGIGDDEQFAAAAALLARALGYDSRVVVGVRLGTETPAGTAAEVEGVPVCSSVCTGEHLAAWIEVRGSDGIWTPVDASPQVRIRPERIEEGEQLPEFTTVPEERDAHEVDPPVGLSEQSDDATASDDADATGWLWPLLRTILLVLALIACCLVPLLFLPAAKRIRARRRRRETNPEIRALGAWEELLDRARDAGQPLPVGTSRPVIAAALGTEPARWAAEQVDRAVFSAESIDGDTADWVWAAVDEHSREQRARRTRWQRLRAAYSPRSLWRRSREGGSR